MGKEVKGESGAISPPEVSDTECKFSTLIESKFRVLCGRCEELSADVFRSDINPKNRIIRNGGDE